MPFNLRLLKLKLKDRFSKAKEKFSVGLDIGTSAIKAVKLSFKEKEGIELCSFQLEPALSDLSAFLRNSPFLSKCCVNISLSGPSTITRYLNFPRMSEDELRKALRFEAQKHIPFSIEEVNLDAHILKENLPDNKMLVLLAAVKKEFINKRLKIIQDAGINVNIADIDSIALINSFSFNYFQEGENKEGVPKAETTALLNIGSSLSNLNILEGRAPCLSRDIQIGGNNFTQKIQDLLGTDFKTSEELKCNPDKERADKITVATEAGLSGLAQEIRASFDYYENQSASSVAKIFLSGGASLFPGLKDMLANLLGVEVQYWDPFKKIRSADNIDAQKLKAQSSQLAIAVGLALRA